MRPYEVIHSEHNKIGRFDVCMDTIVIDGKTYPYSYTKMKSSIAVLPIFDEHPVLIYQYRHSVDKWLYEVIAGGIEKDEEPWQAALRECEEESGYLICKEDLIDLGIVYPVAGTSDERMHLFAGKAIRKIEMKQEPTEFVKPVMMSFSEWEKKIEDNEFDNMYGIALLHKYQLWLKIHCK